MGLKGQHVKPAPAAVDHRAALVWAQVLLRQRTLVVVPLQREQEVVLRRLLAPTTRWEQGQFLQACPAWMTIRQKTHTTRSYVLLFSCPSTAFVTSTCLTLSFSGWCVFCRSHGDPTVCCRKQSLAIAAEFSPLCLSFMCTSTH